MILPPISLFESVAVFFSHFLTFPVDITLTGVADISGQFFPVEMMLWEGESSPCCFTISIEPVDKHWVTEMLDCGLIISVPDMVRLPAISVGEEMLSVAIVESPVVVHRPPIQ